MLKGKIMKENTLMYFRNYDKQITPFCISKALVVKFGY